MRDYYFRTIYRNQNNRYDEKLCRYLRERFFVQGGASILDVGCGTCRQVKHMAMAGMRVTGVDERGVIIGDLADYVGGGSFTASFWRNDIETEALPCQDSTFDYVFSKSLIEHLVRPDNMIDEAYRVLKPGGIIVIMTPEWRSNMKWFWDDYSHYHAYTQKSLADLLRIKSFGAVNCEVFYQLPWLWRRPELRVIPRVIAAMTPDSWRWKDSEQRNGKDRKLIRFSKERMLLAYGTKGV